MDGRTQKKVYVENITEGSLSKNGGVLINVEYLRIMITKIQYTSMHKPYIGQFENFFLPLLHSNDIIAVVSWYNGRCDVIAVTLPNSP